MRFLLTVFVTLFLLAGPAIAAAQTGTLTGRVLEPATRAPVSGATVTVRGADAEAITDAGGNYELELEPGTYTLEIEAGADFETRTIEGVEVTADQPATRGITLARSGDDAAEFGEYTVRGGLISGSAGSVLAKKQEAEAVTEVIGSEQMTRSGDSNAADTVGRLTGLTVENDKFAVIRGQPKRYTSSTLNGLPLPSLDPIRNITPLDLFPSQALSNITVQKSYTADRIGSFGAGQVQLNTVEAPEEDFLELSASLGANSESTGEDGLEFDTGDDALVPSARVPDVLALPASVEQAQQGVPIPLLPPSEQTRLGRSFSDELMPSEETLGPDFGFSLAAGQREETSVGTAGLRLAVGWSRSSRFEEEQRKILNNEGTVANPQVDEDSVFTENRTEISTNFGALAGLSLTSGDHSIASNTMILRDGTERTEVADGTFNTSNGLSRERRLLLEYEQRELFAQQLTGSHDFDVAKLDWRYQLARSERNLPDRRRFNFENPQLDGSGEFLLDVNNPPTLGRRFNTVEEDTDTAGIDVTIPVIERDALAAEIKTGLSQSDRERRSQTRSFSFNVSNANRGDPVEEIFADQNTDNSQTSNSVSFSEFGTADDYNGEANVDGAYVQADVTWTDRLRVVGGLRSESADFQVTTFRAGGAAGAQSVQSGFDETETLPSLVASVFLTENTQLRLAATRSISYPVLVEVSDTSFINPDTDERFFGNPDLGPATIDSFDLRWEWYPSPTEAFTAGLFYKEITDPIERTFNNTGGGGQNITLENADEGEVTGIELSGRFELARLSDALSNFYVLSNLALIDSEVTLDPSTTVATNTTRALEGQADSLFNLQLGYQGGRHTGLVGVNHVGERLDTAGVNGIPDEFREPVTKLNAKWAYSVTNAATVSLTLDNITNEEIEETQGSFTTSSFEEGTTAKLGFSYRF